jgi:hypothetical protein
MFNREFMPVKEMEQGALRPSSFKGGILLGLDFLRVNPVLLFQVIVFIKQPSLPSFLLIFIGLIAGHLFVNIIQNAKISYIRFSIIPGCVNKYAGCTYKMYLVREYLSEDAFRDIDSFFSARFVRIFDRNASLERLIKIYVIKKGTSRVVPAQLICYPIALFASHIFVRDEPEKAGAIQRFQILHEIGHTQFRMLVEDFSTLVGVTPLLFYLGWLSGIVIWDLALVVPLLCFLAVMVLLNEDRKLRIERMRLKDEILADAFAIYNSPRSDLQRIATNSIFYNSIRDESMNPLDNTIRVATLKRNIEHALADRDELFAAELFSMIKPSTIAFLASAVFIIAIFGFFATTVTWWTLVWYGLVAIGLGITYLFFQFLALVLESVVDSALKSSSAAAD